MANIGLFMAAAAAGCCAYTAGQFMERWVARLKAPDRSGALVMVGMMTVANVMLVHLAARFGVPIRWGLLYILLQIQVFVGFAMLHFGQPLVSRSVSMGFVGVSIGTLAVQLVGLRLAFVPPDMPVGATLWWSGGSFVSLSLLAVKGMLRAGLP